MEHTKPLKRFALTETPHRPGMWTVTDTYSGVCITFAEHVFRDTQEIALPNGGQGLTAEELAELPGILRDITTWMMRFNYDLCAPNISDEREAMGRRILQLRKEAGWTGAELSRRSGVTEPNINRIEKGKYSFNFDTLVKLAQAFGMKVDFVKPANPVF